MSFVDFRLVYMPIDRFIHCPSQHWFKPSKVMFHFALCEDIVCYFLVWTRRYPSHQSKPVERALDMVSLDSYVYFLVYFSYFVFTFLLSSIPPPSNPPRPSFTHILTHFCHHPTRHHTSTYPSFMNPSHHAWKYQPYYNPFLCLIHTHFLSTCMKPCMELCILLRILSLSITIYHMYHI